MSPHQLDTPSLQQSAQSTALELGISPPDESTWMVFPTIPDNSPSIAARIHKAFARGIPRHMIQSCLDSGILRRTDQRGIY